MPLVLWCSFIFATAVYICGPIMDPDLWWHITAGRWIIANGAIPTQDYWNLFGAGHPWRAYSWSVEILFALIDQHYSMHGLLIAKIVLALLLAFSLFYVMGRLSADWFVGGVLGIFATSACFNHFTLRPQSLVWVYFTALLLVLELIAQGPRHTKHFFSLSVIMCLWANTHLSAALGVGTVVAWLFVGAGWRITAKAAGFALLGTLFTPYLGGEWLTFFSKTGHPFAMKSIAEFQAATIMQHSTAFMVIIFGLLLLMLHFKPRALDLLRGLLCAAFTLAALAIVKFLPFAVILVCACVACMYRTEREALAFGNLSEAINRARALFFKIPQEGLSFVLLCSVVINFMPLWRAPLSTSITPVKAVDFILEHHLPHPILNDFGRGGYMMYRLSDAAGNLEHKVPIDGRTNVNPENVWTKAHDAFFGKNNWKEYFDLVQPNTVLWPSESPLTSILLADVTWCEVFRSGDSTKGFAVFVKRDEVMRRAGELSSPDCG